MPDLTAGELVDLLSGLDEDTPIRFAHQPAWPFEYRIDRAEIVLDSPRAGYEHEDETVVYLVEGGQTRYLPVQVADHIGWGER